jgi:anti-sigma factor RsiW
MGTIRCWRLRSALTSYVDNEVSTGERLRVESHLRRCDECRRRVSREQAVRQRLRDWSVDMRTGGVSPSWPAEGETRSPRRAGALLRIGALSTAAIALALVLGSRWPGGDGVVLAARGQITDSRCASGHTHSAAALSNMSSRDCVRRCVEMGAQYVFVSEGVVYSIRNQDLVDLTTWAGQDVQLEGEVRHNVLTVSSVRPLTARRSAYGLFSRTVRVS